MSSSKPGSLRAATIAAGVRVLGRAGVGERNARSFLGQQLKHFGFGVLAEAIDAIEPKLDTIAEPRSWIAAYVQSHAAGAAKPIAGSRSGSRVRGNHSACENVVPAPKARPLATAEFLGISPGLQQTIEEQNRRLQEEADARFRWISRKK